MTSEGLFMMKQKELDRHNLIIRVCNKEIKQSRAAELLHLSVRQVKRLCRVYRKEGVSGFIHKHRGKVSNHHLSQELEEKIIELAQTHYHDFGPTFMAEKLLEKHNMKISKEKLRLLLIAKGLWKLKRNKEKTLHQQRKRRPHFGELIQIDGSPHDWLEGLGPRCCLIVFIDDATSEVLYLRFEATETTNAYFRGLFSIIQNYGLPISLYSDKHGIFRVNQGNHPQAQTQFGRACEQLGIGIINANSPQAKGRVERSNQTHQDRLVKEPILANISDIQAANAFLEAYRQKHNQRFSIAAKTSEKAFRPLSFDEESLKQILSRQEKRKVSKNLEISFENKIYQIQFQGKGRRLQQAMITVCCAMNDEVSLLYQGKKLDYKVFEPEQKRPPIVDEKMLNPLCDQKLNRTRLNLEKPYKPSASHPWRL